MKNIDVVLALCQFFTELFDPDKEDTFIIDSSLREGPQTTGLISKQLECVATCWKNTATFSAMVKKMKQDLKAKAAKPKAKRSRTSGVTADGRYKVHPEEENVIEEYGNTGPPEKKKDEMRQAG